MLRHKYIYVYVGVVQYVIAAAVHAEFLMAQIHIKRQSTVQHTGQQPQYSDIVLR